MVTINDTELDAMDIYDKLDHIKIANGFLIDALTVMFFYYEKKGEFPIDFDPQGVGILYMFINDKLTEVMKICNPYDK